MAHHLFNSLSVEVRDMVITGAAGSALLILMGVISPWYERRFK